MRESRFLLAICVLVGSTALCPAGRLDSGATSVDMNRARLGPRIDAGQRFGSQEFRNLTGIVETAFLTDKAAKTHYDILGLTDSQGQKEGAQDDKPAEEVYKNIQVFKGIPSKRILAIMGGFKMALGVDCTHCHVQDQWEKDDLKPKVTARKMVSMVMDLNNRQLADIGKVSCYTCHRGDPHPLLAPPSK